MNERVTERQIRDRLEENGLACATLPLQNGVRIAISQHGGRVLGPFLEPGGDSLFWVNPAFGDPGTFRRLAESDWNLGGERWWVAPEIQYLCRDRYDYANAEYIQPQMDPGNWLLEQAGPDRWRLYQDMTLEVFNFGSGHKELRMETLIGPAMDPLRLLSDYERLTAGVIYAGYEQEVTLSERRHDDILSGAWNVVELYPGGQMLVPTSPYVETTDYLAPVDDRHQTIHSHHVSLRITGRQQYLVGYKAAHVTGRLAYLTDLDGDRSLLIVRGFFSYPSSLYLDEPPEVPGRRGDSVRIYNDDGAYGGYGEMEVYGRAIGGETGRSKSTDTMALWLYVGARTKLEPIVAHLLGIRLQ